MQDTLFVVLCIVGGTKYKKLLTRFKIYGILKIERRNTMIIQEYKNYEKWFWTMALGIFGIDKIGFLIAQTIEGVSYCPELDEEEIEY